MHERTLLESERGERFHLVAILKVLLAEALRHKTFFHLSLQPKGKPRKSGSRQNNLSCLAGALNRAFQTGCRCRWGGGQSIGAGVHERVILLHGHTVAPIAAEHEPGPDAEGNPRQHREKARDRDGYSHGEN
jgi:hypothetical protein